MFRIVLSTHAEQDLAELDNFWRQEIVSSVEVKLSNQPEIFGKPLRNVLKNYRCLRVGNYRIVFRIEESFVKVVAILPRPDVYEAVIKRLK